MSRWFPFTRFPFRGVVLYQQTLIMNQHIGWKWFNQFIRESESERASTRAREL